jgi:hypothetical protein
MLVETLLLVNKPSLLLILLTQLPLLIPCAFSLQMDSTNASMFPILPTSMLLILAVLLPFLSTMIAEMLILETPLDAITILLLANYVLKAPLITKAILLTLSPSLLLMLAVTLPTNQYLLAFLMT